MLGCQEFSYKLSQKKRMYSLGFRISLLIGQSSLIANSAKRVMNSQEVHSHISKLWRQVRWAILLPLGCRQVSYQIHPTEICRPKSTIRCCLVALRTSMISTMHFEYLSKVRGIIMSWILRETFGSHPRQ